MLLIYIEAADYGLSFVGIFNHILMVFSRRFPGDNENEHKYNILRHFLFLLMSFISINQFYIQGL